MVMAGTKLAITTKSWVPRLKPVFADVGSTGTALMACAFSVPFASDSSSRLEVMPEPVTVQP